MSIGRSRYSNTRLNSAIELCTSTPVLSSIMVGRNNWVCSVVNATRVPTVMVLP
ncbi:Uncharacterised protein [Mycobacteroides abscessus subsp. abscessus]|nr:Uncharacterised protein [Mycobacteroides abscessus subsp. abscessus]